MHKKNMFFLIIVGCVVWSGDIAGGFRNWFGKRNKDDSAAQAARSAPRTYTAQHLINALFAGRYDNAKRILKAGVQDINEVDVKGNSALIWAVRRDEKELVELLLAKDGIDLNHANDDQETALVIAAQHGNKELVEMLLSAGARRSRKAVDFAATQELKDLIGRRPEGPATKKGTDDYHGAGAVEKPVVVEEIVVDQAGDVSGMEAIVQQWEQESRAQRRRRHSRRRKAEAGHLDMSEVERKRRELDWYNRLHDNS